MHLLFWLHVFAIADVYKNCEITNQKLCKNANHVKFNKQNIITTV